MTSEHRYRLTVEWTGNLGTGTAGQRSYSRNHEISADGRTTITGSSDPAFRGDVTRWNPEQLFVASVSQCHLLWYLSLAAAAGIVVTAYVDHATGKMLEEGSGAGQFASMTLSPTVTISDSAKLGQAYDLHAQVGAYCFIARSVNFALHHHPTILC